jgi:hypothetical protein
VISLDEALRHPLLERGDAATLALARARQALATAKPDSPRRLVLEAAAIEAAVLGGFADEHATPRLFVVLLRNAKGSAIAAVVMGERRLSDFLAGEPGSACWVYVVPTAMHADNMRYPIIDVARVTEWKKPAAMGKHRHSPTA